MVRLVGFPPVPLMLAWEDRSTQPRLLDRYLALPLTNLYPTLALPIPNLYPILTLCLYLGSYPDPCLFP